MTTKSVKQVNELSVFGHFVMNVLRISEKLNTSFHTFVRRATGSALTHRTAIGGLALMGGMMLASGADSLAQAVLATAVFGVAGICFYEREEVGEE